MTQKQLSAKTGSKLSQVHKAPNLAQPAHTGAPRIVRVAVSWPQRRRVTGPADRVAGADGRVVARKRLCRGPHPCRVATQSQQPSFLFGHNTRRCIEIQILQQPGSLCHDTTYGLVIHSPHQPCSLSHDTKFVS